MIRDWRKLFSEEKLQESLDGILVNIYWLSYNRSQAYKIHTSTQSSCFKTKSHIRSPSIASCVCLKGDLTVSTLSSSFATDDDDNFISEIWPIPLNLGFDFSNIFTRQLGLRGLDLGWCSTTVRYSYDLRANPGSRSSPTIIVKCKFNDTNRHRGWGIAREKS